MSEDSPRRKTRKRSQSSDNRLRVNLRHERERLGLDIDDVLEQTRIPLRFIEFLETGDRSRVQTGPYLLAYKKQYLRFLGLPTDAVLCFKMKEANLTRRKGPRTQTVTTTGFIPSANTHQLVTYSIIIAMIIVIVLRAVSTFIDKTNLWKDELTETTSLQSASSSMTTTNTTQEPVLEKNARVTVRAREDLLLDITTDGQIKSLDLTAGEKEYLDFYGRLDLWTKNVNQLDIYYNGRKIQPQGSLTRERTLVFATNRENL